MTQVSSEISSSLLLKSSTLQPTLKLCADNTVFRLNHNYMNKANVIFFSFGGIKKQTIDQNCYDTIILLLLLTVMNNYLLILIIH